MYIQMHLCVCICVYMCVCVCMYVFARVRVCVHVCVECMHAKLCIFCMYVCNYGEAQRQLDTHVDTTHANYWLKARGVIDPYWRVQ